MVGNYPSGNVTDPTGHSQGSSRIRRGGSWRNRSDDCRSAIRRVVRPLQLASYYGFRVARTYNLSPAEKAVGLKTPPLAIAPFDATQAKQHQQDWADQLGTPIETTNSIGMKLAFIPAGEFMMGLAAPTLSANLPRSRSPRRIGDSRKRRRSFRPTRLTFELTEPGFQRPTHATERSGTCRSKRRTRSPVRPSESRLPPPDGQSDARNCNQSSALEIALVRRHLDDIDTFLENFQSSHLQDGIP